MYYATEIVNRIKRSESIVIYGAGHVAKEVANCLISKPYRVKIDSFMVSDKKGNPPDLLGIPVISIEDDGCKFIDSLILVASLEKYQEKIVSNLSKHGFENVIQLGFESDLWSELRGNFFVEYFNSINKKYIALEDIINEYSGSVSYKSISIYQVRCHVDKRLNCNLDKYSWEIPIQAGAELTDTEICEIRDNIGENISSKNKQYCELTALYWIWKNDNSDYKGLCHYRRHFSLNPQIISKIEKTDIDVIVTIPILNYPSVGMMYKIDHNEKDWGIMKDAIREICPEYYDDAIKLQDGIYYYAYNMFVARKEIFDEYCCWLFSILEYCEKNCVEKKDKYQNRYIGFLSERLFSIYILHNWDKLKIAHAKKEFLY